MKKKKLEGPCTKLYQDDVTSNEEDEEAIHLDDGGLKP